MSPLQEDTTKASQAASLLVSDIRDAHATACEKNQLAEMILIDILAQAVDIDQKLARLANALQ